MRGKTISTCKFGTMATCVLSSPIGNMMIRSCPKGLHSIGQIEEINDENFKPDASRCVKWISGDEGTANNQAIEKCFCWLEVYFQNPSNVDTVARPPLCLSAFKTATFTQKVLLTLAAEVRVGQTVSYGQLAKLVDNPKAAQAVGSAMRSNPFQLLVPCHRVTRSSSLGLYANGTRNSVKKWLLEHESVKNTDLGLNV